MAGEKQLIHFLQKNLDDMKKIFLTNQGHCCCRCNFLFYLSQWNAYDAFTSVPNAFS
jgi:hypothetical protein